MTDDESLISVNDSCLKNTVHVGQIGAIVGKLWLCIWSPGYLHWNWRPILSVDLDVDVAE